MSYRFAEQQKPKQIEGRASAGWLFDFFSRDDNGSSGTLLKARNRSVTSKVNGRGWDERHHSACEHCSAQSRLLAGEASCDCGLPAAAVATFYERLFWRHSVRGDMAATSE